MPSAYKQLFAAAPAATTLATLYTAAAGTQVIVSTLSLCNRSSTPTTVRLAHAAAGAADTPAQYFMYDVPLAANQAVMITTGICLSPTDVLRGYVGAATVSLQAWGEERT